MKSNFSNPISKRLTEDIVLNLMQSAQKTGRFRDPIMRQHLKFLSANADDAELKEILLEDLTAAEIENIENPDSFRATNPLPTDELIGDIGIGYIQPHNQPWLIPAEMLTEHLLVCGRTGGGKTNVILLLLGQILEMQRC
ncbi:DUF87 domain-containing protein [Candidatus Microgenomates bacterium]|nr:DUF87 domain-containing protein [Candidatus Microgenomates bacterium]